MHSCRCVLGAEGQRCGRVHAQIAHTRARNSKSITAASDRQSRSPTLTLPPLP
jgi:hypothetical protein